MHSSPKIRRSRSKALSYAEIASADPSGIVLLNWSILHLITPAFLVLISSLLLNDFSIVIRDSFNPRLDLGIANQAISHLRIASLLL